MPSTIFGPIGTITLGLGPTGNDLLLLQATWQDWQPMQFWVSWNRKYWLIGFLYLFEGLLLYRTLQ